jgi:hypothetical protein
MSKRILLSVFAVALAWSTAIVLAQEQAPAPSFKEGDTWQFNITRKGQAVSSTAQLAGTYELAFLQGKFKLYQVSGSQKTELEIVPSNEGLLSLVGQREQRPHLKFPLSVGQKWTYEYTNRPIGAKRDQNRSVEVSVVGMEQVTTPAGSFKAYKLIRTESWPVARGLNTNTTTYFYSPETRSTVKRSTANDTNSATVELELTKFTPGN